MQGEEKASFFIRLLIVIGFFILGASCFWWFIYSAVYLITAFFTMPPVIEFSKVAMSMLGASVGLFFILVGGIQGLLEKGFSKKSEALLVKGMLVGVIIMFALPQVVHYAVSEIIPKDRYIICEKMSYQWMMHKIIIYTDSQTTCDNLIKEEEIRLSKPWF